MKTSENEILKNILQIRVSKKITQKEMGEKMRITESAYNRKETPLKRYIPL